VRGHVTVDVLVAAEEDIVSEEEGDGEVMARYR